MNNIQDVIENKISKFKADFHKRKENSKNNDLINELQLKKTKLLIDMGILANQKIRQGNLKRL